MPSSPAAMIAHKRDGGEHEPDDIARFIEEFGRGDVADYQMTAWLMAVYLRHMSDAEMIALTRAMLHSGKILQGADSSPRVDKHSTGGVGDKISLPLAPLVAACGVHVPMISGRGLGHTGGTLDKLESIPGYDTQLSARDFSRVIRRCGASIIGQTKNIAPADRRIYALRDVTATVACRPLIVASILSKKLAEDLDGLVLDVKVGRGAFMKDRRSARALAKSLVSVSTGLGTPAVARLTRMEEPLGTTIGNALEVREAIDILKGEGPEDTTELTIALGADMLTLAGVCEPSGSARQIVKRALASGAALARFAQMIELHGGNPNVVHRPQLLPATRKKVAILSPSRGYVHEIDSLHLARVALELGAGRKRAEDVVDHAVGIELHARVGDEVSRGERLATLHVRPSSPDLSSVTAEAFRIARGRPPASKLFVGRAVR